MKVFDIDFRKGTLKDSVAGINGVTTGVVPISRREKGLAAIFPGNNENFISYGINSVFSFPNNIMSIECCVKLKRGVVYGKIFGTINLATLENGFDLVNIDSTFNQIWFGITGGNDLNHAGYPIIYDRWIHIIGTCDAITNKIYVNGIKGTDALISPTYDGTQTREFTICGDLVDNRSTKAEVAWCRLYNHILTEAERAKAYSDFLNSYPMLPEKYPQQALINKPMDLSREKDSRLTQLVLGTWVVDAGSPTINGDIITFNSALDGVRIAKINDPNKKYRIRCRISNYVGGVGGGSGLTMIYNGATSFNTAYANGVYDYILINANPFNAYMYSLAGTTGTVEVISVQEVTGLVAAYNMIPSGSTFVDISGNGNNGTIPAGVMSTKEGIKTNGKTFTAPNSTIGVSTFLWRGIIHSNNPVQQLVGRGTGDWYFSTAANNAISFRLETAGGIRYATSITNAFAVNIPITIIGTYDGVNITLYINGVQSGTPIAQTGAILDTGDLRFGGYSDTVSLANCTHIFYKEYNHVLSLQEIKDYHNSFVKPYLLEDFSSEGADEIAKVPTGWIKQSGSFCVKEFQMSITELNDISSLSVARGTSILNTDGSYTYIVTNKIIDVQGYYKNCYVADKKYRFSFFAKSTTIAQFFYWGITSQSNVIPVNNPSLTTEYQYYEFLVQASDATMYFGYLDADVGQTFTWKNFKIQEVTGLDTIKSGTKYLECLSGGQISIPSIQTNGEWRFDYYKETAGLRFDFVLCANKPDPSLVTYIDHYYWFSNVSNEGLDILRNSDNLTLTAANYTQIKTWYSIKVTRSKSGEFTLFIKGGSFVPTVGYDGWTLVSTVGGSGTNPVIDTMYNISKYISLFMNTGDRITNIKLTDGIKQ